jgi:hypothetical protein
MNFQLYNWNSQSDDEWKEKELSVLRVGDRWLFEVSYYRSLFTSWGIDFSFTPRVPLSEVLAVRIYWNRNTFNFSLLPKQYFWDEDIAWYDSCKKPNNEGA